MTITCPNVKTEYKNNILQAHNYKAENTKNQNTSSKWLENFFIRKRILIIHKNISVLVLIAGEILTSLC